MLGSSPAGAQETAYTPSTPTLATLSNPTTCTAQSTATCAPWNEYQGDTGTAAYSSNGVGTVLPTYTPGGVETTTDNGVSGASVTVPNLSVSPSASSGTDGVAPYPSGTVGTPGPLDGYCGSGDQPTESSQSVSRQTPDTTLPLAPSYFPHIVRNADGSLTGYFDYRPKDADEALMAATSTDNGKDWTYDGEALEQNPGYCPSTDVNDDGQGHANVVTLSNGNTFLYTLPRASGDMQGVGLVVHQFDPTAQNPLGTGAQALPESEQSGVDPDGFATAAASVPHVRRRVGAADQHRKRELARPARRPAGSSISPQDQANDMSPSAANVIDCTVTLDSNTTDRLHFVDRDQRVNQGDLIEQVIGYVSAQTGSHDADDPDGPQHDERRRRRRERSTSRRRQRPPQPRAARATSASPCPLTGSTYNTDAPNRVVPRTASTVYCSPVQQQPDHQDRELHHRCSVEPPSADEP